MRSPSVFVVLPKRVFEMNSISRSLGTAAVVVSRGLAGGLFGRCSTFGRLKRAVLRGPLILLGKGRVGTCSACVRLLSGVLGSGVRCGFRTAGRLALSVFCKVDFSVRGASGRGGPGGRGVLFRHFRRLLGGGCVGRHRIIFCTRRLYIDTGRLSIIVGGGAKGSTVRYVGRFITGRYRDVLLSDGVALRRVTCGLGFPSRSMFDGFFGHVAGVSPHRCHGRAGWGFADAFRFRVGACNYGPFVVYDRESLFVGVCCFAFHLDRSRVDFFETDIYLSINFYFSNL